MRSFLAIGLSIIVGSAAGLGARPARAQDSSDYAVAATSAQRSADEARARADHLAAQGGWAYKTGAVDRANADAARYQAEADQARAAMNGVVEPAAPASPALMDAQERLEALKSAGGWAYKTGAVSRAEADVRELQAPEPAMTGEPEALPPANWSKPVDQTLPANR
jgi:hypothetical protein